MASPDKVPPATPGSPAAGPVEGGSVRLFAGSDHRLVLKEGGLVDFYSVVVTSRPKHAVEIVPSASSSLIVITPTVVRITPEDWRQVRTVMVRAIDRPGSDAAKDAFVLHTCRSKDPRYQSPRAIVNPTSILCSISENDAPFVFATGDGEYGQTGLGHVDLVRRPCRIDLKQAVNSPLDEGGGVGDRLTSAVRPWHMDPTKGKKKKKKKKKKTTTTMMKSRKNKSRDRASSVESYDSRAPERPASARPSRSSTSMMLQRILLEHKVIAETASEAIARRREESQRRQHADDDDQNDVDRGETASGPPTPPNNHHNNTYGGDGDDGDGDDGDNDAQDAEEELMSSLFPNHRTHDDHVMLQSEQDRALFQRRKRAKLSNIHALKRGDREARRRLTNNKYPPPSHVSGLSCGLDHSAMVTGKGKLYTWGNGISGALGLGEQANRRRPCVWNFTDALRCVHKRVKAVSCGEDHTVIVVASGLVLSFGNGDNGRLGHGDSRPRSRPKVVESLRDIHVEAVACGGKFTLLMAGSSGLGGTGGTGGSQEKQKGNNGGSSKESNNKEKSKDKDKDKDARARPRRGRDGGGGGIVLSAGHGRTGALGHGDRPSRAARRSDCRTFQQIKTLKGQHPVAISAGAMHSVVLCTDGRMLTFGFGETGQLGRRLEGSSSGEAPRYRRAAAARRARSCGAGTAARRPRPPPLLAPAGAVAPRRGW